MAITITIGSNNGIDVAVYLADFDANFAPVGFGYFSADATDFSGNQYAATEQSNLIPNPALQGAVADSGGAGINYDFATHVVGGNVDAVSFGYGMTYDSVTDSFPLTQLDMRISGLGLVNQSGSGNLVSSLLDNLRTGSTATLNNLLTAAEINFVGAIGADTFTGYSHNDTINGGDGNDTLGGAGGNDTLTGGTGNDTFVYDGVGADVITDFSGGPSVGDVIRVTGLYTTFAQIQANTSLVNGGADTRIDFGAGNTLTLAGFTGTLNANDFSFGSVVPSGPEIAVSGNGSVIVDGDTTASVTDDTDFGAVGVGASVVRTFTVSNIGSSDLTTSKLKLPKGFVLVEGLSSTIAAGGSDTFTVRVDTAKAAALAGSITFTTNDPNETAFDFGVKANVIVIPPEIEVSGNGNDIADGDTTPSVTDDTDFGTLGIGETGVHTFTVNNTGAGVLNISQLKLPKGFVLVEGLSSTIASGGSDTFTVRVDTAKAAALAGSITFTTNDPNETAFDFGVKANVIVIPPEIEVTGNGNFIADGDTTPSVTDDTNFGTVGVGETAVHTFTVNNTGAGVLSLSQLKLPKGFVLVEGLSSTIAAGGSDTFTVRIDTAKAATLTGSISFTTNDPDEGAFNFNLTGNVVTAATAMLAAFGEYPSDEVFVFETTSDVVLYESEGNGYDAYALGQMHDFDLI